MNPRPEPDKLLHDLESKCASLKSGARLLRECPPAEKREMLALMNEAAQDVLRYLSEFKNQIDAE